MTIKAQIFTVLSLGLLAGAAAAQSTLDEGAAYFLDTPETNKYAVIITGPTVGQSNIDQFRGWTFRLHDVLARDYGYSSDSITLLYDRGESNSSSASLIDGAADREGIEMALTELAARVEPGDQITLYLIGHGSGAEDEAKFNIVGPDLTGPQFAEILDQFERQDMVIINTTSASYGFSTALSSEGRVVISATRSPSEKYDPVFSRYFIEALEERRGDRDKNNRVSMLEAFQYAKASVEQWYEEQGRLASEHAGLDDNGDALFSLDPAIDEADGRLAEIAFIDRLSDDSAGLSADAMALKLRMQELERSVFILRSRKADYLEADYWQEMEALLLELARTTGQFNELVNE
ncbi:MAG: hypothetical protein MRY76_00825 [Pseudomonadales bacterium]|nr:hypothetical protein [Pseudomonadales bacterium]